MTTADNDTSTIPLTAAQAISELTGDPNFMTSLARGLAVISAFSKQRRRQTIADLSRHTGLPRATVRRCLYTLRELGYVESNDYLFQLRPKILTLGYAYLSSTQLAVTAQPFLERVSNEVDESCSLAVFENDEILYVGRSATKRVMSVALTVGSRLPAYCTSMGRVLLAAQTPEQQAAYFARVKRLPLTEYTVYKRTALNAIFKQINEQGYAIIDQELELGLCSIAVPVRNIVGTVVAAMNIGIQSSKANLERMETILLPALQLAAKDLSLSLGV